MGYEQRFAENEATGSRVLTSFGCYLRHSRPREQAYLTKKEEWARTIFSGARREERAERMLLNDVARYRKMGFALTPGMTLEEWVHDIKNILMED